MNLFELLGARLLGKVAVIGVGSPMHGDDGAGCRVARRLRESGAACVFVAGDIPESVLCQVAAARPETVVFVDAVDLGAEPGGVALLEQGQLAGYCPTTHRVPLRLLMEILRRETGADVFLLAIQPGRVGLGWPMSGRVRTTTDLVAAALEGALGATRPTTGRGRGRAARETGS